MVDLDSISNNLKVSIIVPVYNNELYIDKALESLLTQTMREIEIIVVDDGSVDSSGKILDVYANKYKNVKVIHQQNQGVSSTRNRGLEVAIGEYVGFMDADDWVESDMYEKLYTAAKSNSCDVIISNFEEELENKKKIHQLTLPLNCVLNKFEIIKLIYPCLIKQEDLNSVCNKLFSNKIIKENRILFPEGVALGEDAVFNIRFFTIAKSCYYLDYMGYHYTEVEGSATRNIIANDYFKRALQVYNEDIKEIKSWETENINLKKLKAIKLLNKVLSFVYVYFKPNSTIPFRQRYTYISNMIKNKEFRASLVLSFDEVYWKNGRYDKFLIRMIQCKCIPGLYLATLYSRLKSI